MRSVLALLIAACFVAAPARVSAGDVLTSDDVSAVRRIVDEYRDAWLRNVPAAVMALLTANAVLLPAHARAPLVGAEAIRRFWFPAESPPAVVTWFETPIDAVEGSAQTAYARGTFNLRFRTSAAADAIEQLIGGAYLMILERQADGRWLISCRMWDDRL